MTKGDTRKNPKVFIPDLKNAGDQFNHFLLDYFDVKAEPVQIASKSDLLMLGGGLYNLQSREKPLSDELLHVWGSGFLFGDDVYDPSTGKYKKTVITGTSWTYKPKTMSLDCSFTAEGPRKGSESYRESIYYYNFYN